jgi:hypothetical protein
VDRLLRYVMRQSFRRFREGDHFSWAVIAAVAFLVRRALREPPHPTLVVGRDESFMISPADAPVPPF